ncbi:1,4-alpha-glucan branching enzyme, partial [Nocardioides cavernae]|nr:1,4-alpha-glucan branching enzyme [Nocardioides cavernae]
MGDFIPDIGEYRAYKFEIVGPDGQLQPLKADPFAFASELRPANASITRKLAHDWADTDHRKHWSSVDPRRVPISIYEVHAGSWDRDADGWFLTWDALADRLIPYVVEMGFT